MESFAKESSSHTIKEIVNGVERHEWNSDALVDVNVGLYYDRADIEVAVRNLVVNGLLKTKPGNETRCRAIITQTHVYHRT